MADKPAYAELEQKVAELQRQIMLQRHWEKAFTESEERFKTQYQNIPIPTSTWQRQGDDFVLRRMNRAAEILLRRPAGYWLGRTARDLFRNMPEIINSFANCVKTKSMLQQEIDYTPRDGGAAMYFMAHQIVLSPDLVLMYLENITERKSARIALQEAHDRLEKEVARRTAELVKTNKKLEQDITERRKAEDALQEKERELEEQARQLVEMNTALKILLEYREEEKKKMEKQIVSHVKKLVFPYLDRMEKMNLNGDLKTYLSIVRANLKDFISPFAHNLSSRYLNLTPTEIQVADLIKQGQSSKEIAALMKVSADAVAFHRANIRAKLEISGKKINLRTYLQSLPL
jgi:DNA-binding CsgD family transcriptional regulator